MSSRSEGKREVGRAAADAREAAREITHSRTERARVVGEGKDHLRDDALVEQQAVQQGPRFVGLGVTGYTVGPELAEFMDSGVEVVEQSKNLAAGKAAEVTEQTKDLAAGKAGGPW
jgi:hypothetical protein